MHPPVRSRESSKVDTLAPGALTLTRRECRLPEIGTPVLALEVCQSTSIGRGFPVLIGAVRTRRGRCKPHKNLLPCASSFAIKTGNREHKTTGAVVSKCALLYRSGVLQLSLTKPASHDRPFTHSGARAGGGISARCGGVPRDPHPHPDGNTPSGPRIRRGCKGLACFSLWNCKLLNLP